MYIMLVYSCINATVTYILRMKGTLELLAREIQSRAAVQLHVPHIRRKVPKQRFFV